MTVVKRQVTVSYTPEQMYELVNDVDRYPEFVTACVDSHKKIIDDYEVEASLEFARSGLHKSFTTRNRLTPYERIDIKLVNGPFKHLEGLWYFSPTENGGCRVELDLEFEFSNRWLGMAFGPVFNQVANKLVDVFCRRAEQVYGDKTGPNNDSDSR
jgi:ribosome-associated toxin RatA of RatAB toxin-antitoxin module